MITCCWEDKQGSQSGQRRQLLFRRDIASSTLGKAWTLIATVVRTTVLGVESRHILHLARRYWSFFKNLATEQAGSLLVLG